MLADASAELTLGVTIAGAGLGLAGTLVSYRLNDRRTARAAARLVYAELLANARVVWALPAVVVRQYALWISALPEDEAAAIAAEGFAPLRDGNPFEHLEELYDFLEETGRHELLAVFRSAFHRDLGFEGIILELQQEAWDAHALSLVLHAPDDALLAVERAYAGLGQQLTIARDGEPSDLLGETFENGLAPVLALALHGLAPLAGFTATDVARDGAALDDVADRAIDRLRPFELEDG